MTRWIVAIAVLTAGAAMSNAQPRQAMEAVTFDQVRVMDDFWQPRMETNRKTTLPHNIKLCEDTGRIDNFAKAGKLMEGEFKGKYYDDSDLYKVLEGAAYTLAQYPDPKLEATIDAIITKIEAAQEDDGYLNTYYTLVEPEHKWTSIIHRHELYCAGHMFEAAVAYHRATGKDTLLNIARKKADHIATVFGHDKRIASPGHEEIELALVKLYGETGEKRYLELSKFFVDVRGTNDNDEYAKYRQAHKPVREQSEIVGHAVRAMYLYSGVADVAALSGDKDLIAAMDRLWESVALRKMYITGAIGASHQGEAFGADFELPNHSAYCETCASIGMAFWNHRLLMMHGDGTYGDVLERVMYNAILAGVSLTGDRFFYVNPLTSEGGHHRQAWFGTACCPSNVVRFLPSIGGYIYATSNDALWVNLYVAGSAEATVNNNDIKITQETRYPWEGRVDITIDPAKAEAFTLKLRLPAWCKAPSVSVNGKTVTDLNIEKGYARIDRKWNKGDKITLDLPMEIQRVQAHPNVVADRGQIALQRGPIIYCIEGADNGEVSSVSLPRDAKLEAEYREDLLGGVVVITGEGIKATKDAWEGQLYQSSPPTERVKITAIPYNVWDNRNAGQMMVWIPE